MRFLLYQLLFVFAIVMVGPTSLAALSELKPSLGYSVQTNTLSQEPNRAFSNTLSVGLGYKLENGISLKGGSWANFTVLEGEVHEDDRFEVGGASLKASGSPGSFKVQDVAIDFGLNGQLTGYLNESNRYNGLRGISGLGAGFSAELTKKLKSSLSGGYQYLFHTYKTSPVSETINTRDRIYSSLSLSYKLTRTFSVSGSLNYTIANDFEGSSLISSSNKIGVSYSEGRWSTFASLRNGSYPEDPLVDPFYYDEFKQRLSVGMSVSL